MRSLEKAEDVQVNVDKTKYIRFNQNQTKDISTLKGGSLKQVDKFTDLKSSVSSTENDINTRLASVWSAIEMLLVIWKSAYPIE